MNRKSTFKIKVAKSPAIGNYYLSNLGNNTLDRSGFISANQQKDEYQKSFRIMQNQTIIQPVRKGKANIMKYSQD